jgi:hypothetical protein
MIPLPDNFEPFPPTARRLLRELDDDWRLTVPGDAMNPLPWLLQHSKATTLPAYPAKDSPFCLVAVLAAVTLDHRKGYTAAVLIPTELLYHRLLSGLLSVYDVCRTTGVEAIPLVGVFFILPKSVVMERDPELFE